jgi:hypothetical protein
MPFVKGQPRPPNAGRKKGTLNKKTIQRIAREDAAKLLEAKLLANDLPIDLMLRIMRDPTQDMHTRLAAARAAAPYCHAQLQAVAHKLVDEKGNPLAPVVNLTVSTPPKLEDKTPRLTHVRAKKGDSAQ